MEVRTISSSKKITVELNVNVETIEYKHSPKYQRNSFVLPFTIFLKDGTNYNGYVQVWENFQIQLIILDVKSLNGTVSMMVSNGKLLSTCKEGTCPLAGKDIPSLFTKISESDQVKFLKGSYTITFEPSDERQLRENCNLTFNQAFNILQVPSIQSQMDVKLVVDDQKFEFNKDCLASISPFFKDLFENYPEENEIPMIDCSTQDIKIFKNIIDKNDIKPDEITLELLKFADKFNVQPLLKFCGNYFGNKLNKDNIFDIALAANMVNDNSLIEKVANFIQRNRGRIDVQDFLKNNPDCGIKIFQIMFK